MVVDGFAVSVAALLATEMDARVRAHCVFSHCSAENGHRKLLEHLQAQPLLDLRLRLGEGSGAALAWPLIESAARLMTEMASFESAGVADKADGMTEIRLLLTAVQYFTRIRVPAWVGHAPERLTGAVRYFPAIGLIVGASGAAVMWLAALVLPAPLPAILSTAVTVLMTGAIHEDGLADTCDGLGGGATRERALEIMKDPRIGVFGAIADPHAAPEDRDAEPDAAVDSDGRARRRARLLRILRSAR